MKSNIENLEVPVTFTREISLMMGADMVIVGNTFGVKYFRTEANNTKLALILKKDVRILVHRSVGHHVIEPTPDSTTNYRTRTLDLRSTLIGFSLDDEYRIVPKEVLTPDGRGIIMTVSAGSLDAIGAFTIDGHTRYEEVGNALLALNSQDQEA